MSTDQMLTIGRQASQCFREHGIPDFPDPIIDQHGQLSLPQTEAGDRAKQAVDANPEAQRVCLPILSRIPAVATGRPQYSPDDLANLLKFAQCMRHNGIPEWPDPKADGSFPISGTPLETEGKSPRYRSARDACKPFWDKGVIGS